MLNFKKSNKLIPIFLLLTQCMIFGFSFIILQKIISYGCPTFLIISTRFFIGSISLFLFSIAAPKNHILYFNLSKLEIKHGVICGIVMLIAFSLQTYGAVYTSSANNALFTGLNVIFVPIIMLIYYKKYNWKLLIYSLICIIGVGFVSNFSFTNLHINYGDAFSIICGFAFAVHFILLEKFTPNVNLSSFTFIQLLTVSILSGLISLFSEKKFYIEINWNNAFILLLFIGVISTAITYLIQSYVQIHLSANTVSIISCSESIFAVIFSLALGYENISKNLIVGFLFIIIAMLLVSIDTDDNTKKIKNNINSLKRKLSMKNNDFNLFKYILTNSLSPIFLPSSVAFAFLLSLLFNSLQCNRNNTMIYLIIMFIIGVIFCTIMLIYIKKYVKKYCFRMKKQEFEFCQNCINNQDKYIFDEYGLITLKEIIKREKTLPNNSKVYNYTMLDDTTSDQNVKNIVENNLKRNIVYKEFYVDKGFEANEDNVELYGLNNLIYCKTNDLFKSAWFDIVLHITPDNKYGYAAVNFTPVHGECVSCPYAKCCNNKNDDVLYKILSNNAVAYLYKQMNLIMKESTNSEK